MSYIRTMPATYSIDAARSIDLVCGYTVYRTERPTYGGSTAILIKRVINHHPVNIIGPTRMSA
ncbi:hypothetical protein PR048_009760 [Dryococelus australis]|uniref:Uncharacterized protein n=1 Tax=Dryococelus australis TaxID=614101 RepID=A0ABQ9I0T3_9NEOP|nr:hypothetical protein PR048_009760 [Dryococelus australis]